MAIRELLNGKPMVAVGLVAVVVVLAGLRLMSGSGGHIVDQRYFYDASSGKLFAGPRLELPPIATASGQGEGYGAVVFSCGDCADEASRFTGWVENYTPEAKRLMGVMSADHPMTPAEDAAVRNGFQISKVPEDGTSFQWVPGNSNAGQDLQLKVIQSCGERKRASACLPK